jgi:hypothetical protein
VQPGHLVRRKEITGGFPYAERFVEEAVQSLVEAIGATPEDMRKLVALGKIARVNYDLPSRFDPEVPSEDRLTVVWHDEVPAAIILESRDIRNYVDTTFGYLGPGRS